ncbi:MAG: mechanosensitive ion channel family protein, partial [Flavobacteriaceae bacterium]|nr:mechanosensitive ion channel family protein [Flavobacteriaceae bacterium]
MQEKDTSPQGNFDINDAIANLWDKLDGWLDAIILKLPNFLVAILV